MSTEDRTRNSTTGHSPEARATGDVHGTAKDAEALQAATRRTDQEAELKRYKRIGIALILGSYASFALPFALPIDPGFVVVLYMGLSVIGVVLYAKAKQRRLWWGVIGLYPVLGPLLSLWILSWKPKTRTTMDFRGGSIAGILASIVGIFLTSPSLIELAASVYLPEDQWYPGQTVGGPGLFFFLSPFILWIVASVIVHLNKYEHASTSKLKPFLIAETVFAGLFFLSFFNSFYVTSKILDVHEVRSEKALSQLQVGMSRHNVETLVFDANVALIAPPREGWLFGTTNYENELYRKVQHALQSTRSGEAVNFSIFSRKEYFMLKPNKKDPSTQRFRRIYILGAFNDISYELLVKYDDTDRLLWARYVSQAYYDGPGPCRVVYIGDSAPPWTSKICDPLTYGKWNTASR